MTNRLLDAGHDVRDGYDVADAYLTVVVDIGAVEWGGEVGAGHDVRDGDDVADAHLTIGVDVAPEGCCLCDVVVDAGNEVDVLDAA